MSESENQEPVCSSDSSGDPDVVGSKTGEDGEACNEAEAKPVAVPHDSPEHVTKNSDPEVVSSSKDSPVQIRNNQEMRDSKLDEDDEDDDSNDGVGGGGGGGSNGDGGLPPICSPFAPHGSSNSKSNPFGSGTNILRGPILRPSAFKFGSPQQSASSQQPSSSFMLRPPKLIPVSGSVGCKVQAEAASSTSTLQFVPLEKEEGEGDKQELVGSSSGGSGGDAGPSSSSGESFVFGRNFSERAVVEVVEGGEGAGGKKRKIEGEEDVSAGGSKKLSVVISEEGRDGEVVCREVITGEEDEVNALQLHCRLFIFDGNSSTWIERGRGLLRLNDSKTADEKNVVNSRLIVRTKGSLRVMLNTKVWEGMRVERVGDKNVRLMAVDLEAVDKEVKVDSGEEDKEGGGGGSAVRIFLVMTTSISDAVSLMNALESRLRRLSSLN